MTNLSKELCEICGIEPKCINCGQTVSDKNPCPKPCNKQKYPDFEKPGNFVRLVNLIYTCGINQPFDYQLATLSAEEDEDFSDYEAVETFQQRYLQVLLFALAKNYSHWDELFFSLVTKAIRKTEWIYE